MVSIVATFTWDTNGEEQSVERSVNAVSVTSEFNRGAWVDLYIRTAVPGLPAGADVTLRRETAFGPALVALGPFSTPAGGWSIRTIPKCHQTSRPPMEGKLRVLCAAHDIENTCDFIMAVAAKLGIVPHTADMSRIDIATLGELQPCGACLPVPACQPAETAFAELLGMIGQETQAVAGWTRIVGAEGYVLVGNPGNPDHVPELRLDEWTWTVTPPEQCHDLRLAPIGAKRMVRRLPEDPHRMLDILFDAEELFGYERETEIPLAPGSVSINGAPHMAVAVRTTINVDEQPEPAAKVELDLIDSAYGVITSFVPRTCTLIGELSGSVWLDDDRSVAITPPAADVRSELPPRLANWNAIECRATDTSSDDAGRCSLPGYVAAPFAPRDGSDTAMYDPWRAGDLVIFQASTFQPLVVLGAYGRKMAEFESEDDVWMNMRGRYRITGEVEIAGTLDVSE